MLFLLQSQPAHRGHYVQQQPVAQDRRVEKIEDDDDYLLLAAWFMFMRQTHGQIKR